MGNFLENKLRRAREMGYGNAVRLLVERLPRYLLLPGWLWFRLKNSTFRYDSPFAYSEEESMALLARKEFLVRTALERQAGGSFLEIGIGSFPNIERVRLMQERGVAYTACDFAGVCRFHESVLQRQGIDTGKITFAGNRVGTYSWTLFEMLRRGEQFDVVYLDGHHTFYVDLPALLLAHQLLKPGGLFLVDDVDWTLDFLKGNMLRSFGEWYIYRRAYDFAEYEPAERALPHIKLMVEAFLVERYGYRPAEGFAMPHWWALAKPAAAGQP